jgi:phosphatidate cytidylyltransferase
MLRWRLILGTLFIAALIGLFWLDAWVADRSPLPPGLILLPLALTVAVAGTREFSAMVRTREPDLNDKLLSVGNWIVVASPWLGACIVGLQVAGQSQLIAAFVIIFAAYFAEMRRYDKDTSNRVTERLALTVLGILYIGVALSFVVRLRLRPEGIFPLVSMLVVVKMGDTGAYTVGRLFGKHKLAPKLSPGKTWEGFFGGLVFSVIGSAGVALAFGYYDYMLPVPYVYLLVYPIVVCLAGVVGDLAESLLKRDFGVKDSSAWMPGFGGVLDLIDSPLFAAPVAWAFWEFGWIALSAP